jgi:hypothetical protein
MIARTASMLRRERSSNDLQINNEVLFQKGVILGPINSKKSLNLDAK